MQNKVYLAFFCLVTKLCVSLKTTDLCLSITEQTRCIGEYSYLCESNYCAVNQESCTDFIEFKTYFQKLKGGAVKKRLISLMSRIKPCPIITILQHPDDVCMSSSTCYSNKGRVHMAAKANANLMRRVYCACKPSHSFRCGIKYW